MNLEIINPHVLKILIAARKEDSIKAISDRISLSYGWTYKWVQVLAKLGVFKLTRMKTFLNENSQFYNKTLQYIKETLTKEIQFNYDVLSLFGIDYCFTKIDSVFIWTKGGYNIARYKNFYPIYIKVKTNDKKLFEDYCKKLNLIVSRKSGVFYKPIFSDDFKVSYNEGIPVDSLGETIDFMEENRYNFEPALEMIKEMYIENFEKIGKSKFSKKNFNAISSGNAKDLKFSKEKIKTKYKEVVTNV